MGWDGAAGEARLYLIPSTSKPIQADLTITNSISFRSYILYIGFMLCCD